jgi:hypothetical protein
MEIAASAKKSINAPESDKRPSQRDEQRDLGIH